MSGIYQIPQELENGLRTALLAMGPENKPTSGDLAIIRAEIFGDYVAPEILNVQLQEDFQVATTKLEEITSRGHELVKYYKEVQAALDCANDKEEQLKGRIDSQQEEIKKLETLRHDDHTELESMERKLHKCQARLTQERSNYDEDLASRERTIKEQNAHQVAMNKKCEELVFHNKICERSTKNLEKKIEETVAKLESKESSYVLLEKKLAEKEAYTLPDELQLNIRRENSTEQRMHNIGSTHDLTRKRWTLETTSLKAQIKKMEQENESNRQTIARLEGRVKDLSDTAQKLDTIKHKNDELTLENERLSAELAGGMSFSNTPVRTWADEMLDNEKSDRSEDIIAPFEDETPDAQRASETTTPQSPLPHIIQLPEELSGATISDFPGLNTSTGQWTDDHEGLKKGEIVENKDTTTTTASSVHEIPNTRFKDKAKVTFNDEAPNTQFEDEVAIPSNPFKAPDEIAAHMVQVETMPYEEPTPLPSPKLETMYSFTVDMQSTRPPVHLSQPCQVDTCTVPFHPDLAMLVMPSPKIDSPSLSYTSHTKDCMRSAIKLAAQLVEVHNQKPYYPSHGYIVGMAERIYLLASTLDSWVAFRRLLRRWMILGLGASALVLILVFPVFVAWRMFFSEI
ncbi:hypothetical protein BDZ94DRAFT_1303012 [Collybia nuda]|uniref:Uncharacterized protein n=1 Tax=Collybia nuda TaxID=64659 RepID=A0A9P5XTR6_9AGAR|nr:hypothetical protein BDZ94DRAFT_1303012 [Collybia nuda]